MQQKSFDLTKRQSYIFIAIVVIIGLIADSGFFYYLMCRVYNGVAYTLSYYNTANDAAALIVRPARLSIPSSNPLNTISEPNPNGGTRLPSTV